MSVESDVAAVRAALLPAIARDASRRSRRRWIAPLAVLVVLAGSTGVAAATGVIWSAPKIDHSVPAVPEWQYYSKQPVRPRRRPGAHARASGSAGAGEPQRRTGARGPGRDRALRRRPRPSAGLLHARAATCSRSRGRPTRSAPPTTTSSRSPRPRRTPGCARTPRRARAPTAARSPPANRLLRPRLGVRVAEEAGEAARVDEDGLLPRPDLAVAHRGGEAGHRLGGVDGLEHDALAAARVLDGAGRGGRELLVARADLLEVHAQLVGADEALDRRRPGPRPRRCARRARGRRRGR